ncbi:MAG TPA: M14 metallopeptidase family protein [Terracidiphilus sp.]|nr:M14 metallopeptidase family protein [Terracidiphilus sp.]
MLAMPMMATAQYDPKITTPKQFFGFNIGDDYELVNYTQFEAYMKKLASESPRMKLVEIGKTEEGRPQYTVILTSAENQKTLEHYREISKKLAMAEGLTDDEAHALAREGKAVVFMDFGIHATETAGAQSINQVVYEMISRNDPETLQMLNNDILLLTFANPDGEEFVSDWYMRNPDPTKRSLDYLPKLFNKYIGHDNARDMFMSNMSESANMNKLMFIDWFPQITHTHHQTGPAGAVVFMPPFRDPFNYNFDPLVPMGVEELGGAMHSWLIARNMPGSATRGASNYSTWWDGGMRTISYFHNAIGLITEVIGNPTPMKIPFVLQRQLPSGDEPMPIAPQEWHMSQTIKYEVEYSRAVFDYAARNRESLLYDMYVMGKRQIEKGSTDSWTITPKRIEAVREAASEMPNGRKNEVMLGNGPNAVEVVPSDLYDTVLHSQDSKTPRAYILTADQPDFPTVTKFINALLKNGIEVEQATAPFEANGKTYPANSYVVKTAQASLPFVLDMFEPQDHPNDFKYPGGPPIPPYDIAGWTLVYQMGIQCDRSMTNVNGPLQLLKEQPQPPAPAQVSGPSTAAGYLVDHKINDAIVLVNRLLAKGQKVYWLKADATADGKDMGTGAMWIPATAESTVIVKKAAEDLGVAATAAAEAPKGEALALKPIRVGLYDQYGGLMPSGWIRWILEQFEFPVEIVRPQMLDAGNLKAKYDVLIFPDGSAHFGPSVGRSRTIRQPEPDEIPEQYRSWLGVITKEKTIPALKQFVEDGGSVVTIGSGTSIAPLLGVPMTSALVDVGKNGKVEPLSHDKFYVPGSILQMTVNTEDPLAYGLPAKVDVDFDSSPAFRIRPSADDAATSTVGWYQGSKLLRSGWAWGQQYLNGATAILDETMGAGKVYVFGPEITFRGQSHGTYKFLFNSLYLGSANPVDLK